LLLAFALGSEGGAQGLAITFLDVGQGDAALIRSPTGRNVLIDAGPSPTRVADWLRRAKVDTIHLAIASHNHADHIGGMPRVLATIPVRNYMENGMAATTRTYARIVTALEEQGIPVLRAEPRRIDLGGGASLRVLASSPKPRSQNDASIGLELTYGSFRALFTGDAEERQREFWSADTLLSAVQVLKISHHGSVNGTDARMLAPLRPCAAVISVGARNSFGHPSRRVLRLLDSTRVFTLRTDSRGEVTITADTTGAFRVATARPPRRSSYSATCQPVAR
jgi:competence protein ComEC